MARSIKKGPYVVESLVRKIEGLNRSGEKRVLKKARVFGNAVMDYRGARPTTVGETSRLSGRVIEVYFTHDAIDSLVAIDGARNEYASPAREGKTGERNLAHGDTITVFFDDRQIDRARVVGNAAGEYHPAVDVGDTIAVKREIVQYDATRIEFVVPKSRIVLDRAAHLIYGDLELRARRVQYDVEQQTLAALRPVSSNAFTVLTNLASSGSMKPTSHISKALASRCCPPKLSTNAPLRSFQARWRIFSRIV